MGAVAVHPSRRFLAVAEKCRTRSPNIYIYTYPELALVKVLKDGTERAYRWGSQGLCHGVGLCYGWGLGCVEADG